MSVFTVVYPFHYTVTADTFNNAIKHFVKSHRDMNINHLIIKDQQRHMEARIKKFWKDGRNFLGLNVYPVENPFTGQIQYLGDNPMRGGDDEAVEDSENFEEFADLELSDEKEMTGGMMSMYPYQGFMGSAAIPAVGYNQPTIGVAPVALTIPVVLAASCAFMLPVATPPNAIVFGSGKITIPDMIRAGFALNIIGVFLVTIFAFYLAPMIF